MVPVAVATGGCHRRIRKSELEANGGMAWIIADSRQNALPPAAGAAGPQPVAMQHDIAGSTAVLGTMLVTAWHYRHRKRCGKHRSVSGRGAVERTRQDSTTYRDGFRVTQYKGARSYGTVDEDDFAEAARIRSGYTEDIRSQQTSAAQRMAEARKRMLRRRLRRGNVWQSAFSTPTASVQRPDVPQQEATADASAASGDSSEQEAASAEDTEGEEMQDEGDKDPDVGGNDLAAVGEEQGIKEDTSNGNNAGSAFFPGLADVRMASPARGADLNFDSSSAPKVPLSSAKRLVADDAARRRCPGRQLAAAASALSVVGQHEDAAALLRYLRDFGVEQDIVQRRLSFAEADALFQEAALRLGLELQLAGKLYAAWEALLAVCAEEQLSQARAAMEALTDVALKLSTELVNQPARQVEVLQAVADAAVLNRSLTRDRQDELQLALALSQFAAGDVEASTELLQRLQSGASSTRRRQQAAWALTVQNVDISGERSAASIEMSALWDELAPIGDAGSGVGAAAISAAYNKRRRSGGTWGLGVGGFGQGTAIIAAVVLFAVPLAIPLAAWFRGVSSTSGS